LKNYSKIFGSLVNNVVIEESEVVARNFLTLQDKHLALEAIKFSQSLGGNPPTTNNRLLNILKLILPALSVFQIQQLVKKR